jgi:hypothetical protein
METMNVRSLLCSCFNFTCGYHYKSRQRISTCKDSQKEEANHPEHSARFNHDMQLQIDCIEWVLEKIEVNKVPNDRLDSLIQKMIKDLEKRKDKAMRRPDTDDLWTKIETLQWVLYVIFAIKNERTTLI